MNAPSWISGATDATPAECGYDPSRLSRLETVFSELLRREKIQCASYALARHGRVFANRSLGPRRFDASLPMEGGVWRKIASVTKVFTALGVLKLVEDGRLMMEMPLAHVLPEFLPPTHGGIRLAHLLTHTSGIAADPGYHAEANPDHAGFWGILDKATWVADTVNLPLVHAPGEKWTYSSVGFALLGEVITRVTDQPYYQWMEKEVFGPLGLRDTFFAPGDRSPGNFSLVSSEEAAVLAKRMATLNRPFLPAGGAFSTCADMLRLASLFLNHGQVDSQRVFGKTTLAAMRRAHVEVPAAHWGDHFPDWQYGLGLEPARHPLLAKGSVWGHEGAGRCAFWFEPDTGLAAAWTLPTLVDWDPDFSWTPRAIIWSGLH